MHCSSDITFLTIWRNNIKDYIRWNMLDSDIRSSESVTVYWSKVLRFIRPKTNCFFNCLNPKGIKQITKLRLGFSHLRDHKFKRSFHYCSCGIEVETTVHYLLHCPNYLHERKTLLSDIKSTLPNILEQNDSFINVFVFGDTSLDNN